MKRIFVIVPALILLILSCSNSSYGEAGYKMSAELPGTPALSGMEDRSVPVNDIVNGAVDTPQIRERKKIMNAYLELTVEDIDSTEKEISKRVLDLGGWIVSSNLYWEEISLVVKIPAMNFESFLSNTEKIGEVDSKSVTADDVTESYFDLKSRIENKIILRDRFRAYLEKANSMDDILSVERQLNDVTIEIEQLEGSFRGLNRDVDYSTVTFVLRSTVIESSSNNFPSFSKAFSSLKYIVVSFIYYLFFVIIYLIIFGVPIVLVLGLFYVIGWGKIGLIRKFFGKLKK
jgi:Domain of unknown function (DUF4349)